MKHTTSTDLRKSLSAMMDRVNEDHEPVLVTRAKGKPVVMISLEDYQAMDETAYLLASPANRAELLAAIAGDDPSKRVTVTMEELLAMERE
jgi:antitoxin YefM